MMKACKHVHDGDHGFSDEHMSIHHTHIDAHITFDDDDDNHAHANADASIHGRLIDACADGDDNDDDDGDDDDDRPAHFCWQD